MNPPLGSRGVSLVTTLAIGLAAANAQQFELAGRRYVFPQNGYLLNVLAVGDVDGDGAADVVLAQDGPDMSTALFRGGPRGLEAVAVWEIGRAAAIGDVDGDGRRDVVLMGHIGNDCFVILNTPGGFNTTVDRLALPPGSGDATAVALGDVDGNGSLDLVVGCTGGGAGQDLLFRNDGRGRFTLDPVALPYDTDEATAVHLTDVDGDGDLDLIVVGGGFSHGDSFVLRNNGSGTFTRSQRLPFTNAWDSKVGDLDGDGRPDLVVAGGQGLLVLRNDGQGNFAVGAQLSSQGNGVCLLDFDGDGRLDLMHAGRQGSHLWRNTGLGVFQEVTATTMPATRLILGVAAAGDFDGDGRTDAIASVEANPHPMLLLNHDGRRFVDAMDPPLAGLDGVSQLLAVDLDQDQAPDLVVDGGLVVWNDGHGRFDHGNLPAPVPAGETLAAGDVDGDGRPDLVVDSTAGLQLLLNRGQRQFANATTQWLPAGLRAHTLVLTHVDQDGRLDLILGTDDGARVLMNTGSGFRDDTALRAPVLHARVSALASADVDLDGAADLLLGEPAGPCHLWRNVAGTYQDLTATHMPRVIESTIALLPADLDADGDPDLVVGSGGDFPLPQRVYRNDRAAGFVDVSALWLRQTATRCRAVAMAVLDQDQAPDLFVGDTEGPVELHTGDPLRGGFRRYVTNNDVPEFPQSVTAMALADLDLDGDLDLVCGVGAAPGLRVFWNIYRQISAPYLPRLGARHQVWGLGGNMTLFLSAGQLPRPVLVGSLGYLHLDPSATSFLGVGISGLAEFLIPNDPSLLDVRFYLQALMNGTRLSNPLAEQVLR